MGKVWIILVFIFMAFISHAQTDTVQTAKPLKEAPESLKSLLNDIITEETKRGRRMPTSKSMDCFSMKPKQKVEEIFTICFTAIG